MDLGPALNSTKSFYRSTGNASPFSAQTVALKALRNELMFLIGITVSIDGDVKTEDSVSVQGIFSGRLEASSIRVGATAHVTGILVASEIIIDGFVTADIYADHLTLSDTSTVRGRIFHAELVMARQAFFEGQSRRNPHPVQLFADTARSAS